MPSCFCRTSKLGCKVQKYGLFNNTLLSYIMLSIKTIKIYKIKPLFIIQFTFLKNSLQLSCKIFSFSFVFSCSFSAHFSTVFFISILFWSQIFLIYSSIVSFVTSQYTVMLLVQPIQFIQSTAWSSIAGFHHGSLKITTFAAHKFNPKPPIFIDSNNTYIFSSFSKSYKICPLLLEVLPSRVFLCYQ